MMMMMMMMMIVQTLCATLAEKVGETSAGKPVDTASLCYKLRMTTGVLTN
jgi:hypothetical protein